VIEWKEFRSPDFDNLKKPGITHYAIGRGEGVTA